MTITAGLDVGGAHLKVALVEADRTVAVSQFPCPLWQGIDKLDAALSAAQPLLSRADHFGVTMTGELSDLFSDRKSGVETLVSRIDRELGSRARFWMGQRGFGSADEARRHEGADEATRARDQNPHPLRLLVSSAALSSPARAVAAVRGAPSLPRTRLIESP